MKTTSILLIVAFAAASFYFFINSARHKCPELASQVEKQQRKIDSLVKQKDVYFTQIVDYQKQIRQNDSANAEHQRHHVAAQNMLDHAHKKIKPQVSPWNPDL